MKNNCKGAAISGNVAATKKGHVFFFPISMNCSNGYSLVHKNLFAILYRVLI